MAKTIKDMAKERYDFRKSTNPKNRPLVMRGFFAYQEGANAVLDIIEKVMQYDKSDERPWLLRGNHLYNELVKKIKELRG